ncbi:MAG: chemotaxis protein [Ramlibacter sp.]|nr:chemotaxis protein [Ramlibacter sp.]
MARSFYAPGFAVFKRMSFLAGFMLAGTMFLLPAIAAGTLFGSAGHNNYEAAAIVGGLTLLAFYAQASLYAYMQVGISRLIGMSEQIADGQLLDGEVLKATVNTNDGASRLWSSMLRMNQALTDIVSQVRSSANTIADGARDIAGGHTHLSRRTQEQAASLEQTAAGIEQLAATARQNAENCASANTLAGAASGVAGKAATQMQDLAVTMKQIDDGARRVADILATVEGLAFQSNILALNAAVEAARAGEQGRGFATVAAEVRSLAQRSAQAAQEIKGLIAVSVDSVGRGKQLVETAGATMSEVVTGVQRVSELIGAVALASREQSTGVAEINKGIALMDAVTQQNAHLVQEVTSAAIAFEQEAARLVDLVGRFKLARSRGAAGSSGHGLRTAS